MTEQNFRSKLIQWSKENPRVLPWKSFDDAYSIWLSEIILQQTRVEQGLPYFLRFKEAFPTVHDLSNATQEAVFKLWEGLGYYSRAKNLHLTAQYISRELHGDFPSTYEGLLHLKGVGNYTAAAIASFAYRLPYAVLDGNVFRVLSRIFGIEEPTDTTSGKKLFQQLANELLDKDRPDEYNQAIMNFGATHCLPKAPRCSDCLFQKDCTAFLQHQVDKYPFKSKKIQKKNRYFNYFIFNENHTWFIEKREGNDIWQGLHQFPMVESSESLNIDVATSICQNQWQFNKPIELKKILTSKQTLSHQYIHATFWQVDAIPAIISQTFISTNDISSYAFPKIIKEFIERNR